MVSNLAGNGALPCPALPYCLAGTLSTMNLMLLSGSKLMLLSVGKVRLLSSSKLIRG